ncbi:ATP-dependent metallopeptidase FtsH/Yme1/Tma family protein [Oribacterium sp. oral taxon 102]|uniref:ATP-dependent zinc metalloprotease FtsH n=1 Tax=Oribacterium sp. oral taxon 102 TaxID=671214 RepID=UPI0015BC2A94|nr:ATP-dependent zinc metalloprotease FtsH [Oribacterium sp. oral taxon 102]NWO21860.1 ATP-dependent metallopeptidase FtsH/Yme1/Tma family protein [Oribacterium sp. oral taxon 102]
MANENGSSNGFDNFNDFFKQFNRQDGSRNQGGPQNRRPLLYFYFIALILIVLLNTFVVPGIGARKIESKTYTEFMNAVDNHAVTAANFDDDKIVFQVNRDGQTVTYSTGRIRNQYVEAQVISELTKQGVNVDEEIPVEVNPLVSFLLSWIFPILIFVALGNWLSKRMMSSMGGMGGGFGLGGFGKSNAREYEKKDGQTVTFLDVAGEDEAKELLTEMVDYLNSPDKYSKIGARIPKGALLVGPPGTGKTLLAKAVAGEAGVPFFSISGSEFVEMFVGMGAAKVRDLFKQAKEKSPCIIFIDEIDAIGKKRNSAGLGGNDEREQTLNQLLTEMDGFDSSKAIIILAATNQPDALDPALLRPGRFDRRVPVELPDFQGRVDILKVHAKKIQMAENVNLEAIAKAAAGASGAELANIINEAALRAVRAGRERVIQSDLEESIEVVIAGYQKKNKVMTDKEKLIVSYHEVGHALVAAKQKNSAPVHKITIIPRTSGALGYTMQVEEEGNHYLYSKEELENKIATLTGGRCAEELIFNTCTTGASNDIEQATKYARAMITRYGMADEIGMVAMEQIQNQYLGGDASLTCSPETQTKIDDMTVKLVKQQHDKAYQILSDNVNKLHEITKYLYEKETITGEEFMEILNRKEVDPSVLAAAE